MEWLRPIIIWFPFLVSILSFSVGLVTYARAPRSTVVKLFANFSIIQSLLAFIEWGYRHAPTEAAAQAWVDAGAVWPLSVATLWSFGWMVSAARARPRLAPWRGLMYPPAVALIVAGFASPQMQRTALEQWWGFSYRLDLTPLMSTALAWASVCSLAVAVLVAIAYRKRSQDLHGVYKAFLLATLAIVGVNVVQGVAQTIATAPLPEFSTLGTGVFVAIIGFAVTRYGMWEFAPGTASETVLETMGDAVVLVDDRQNIRYVNPAAESMIGPSVDLVGAPASDHLPASLLGADAVGAGLDASIAGASDGELQVSVRIESMPARIGGRVLVLRDTGEQIRHRQELSYLAFHDALTGIGNRELFFQRLDEQCATYGERDDATAACLVLDLDRFKEVNDAYGHATGDDVLIATAARLESTIRTADGAFRLGGDEFALIIREMRGRDDPGIVVRKLLAAFEEPVQSQTLRLNVSASIGYTVIEAGDTAEVVFARADAGLFEAKERRATAVEFHRSAELPQTRRALMHRRVSDAIPSGAIRWHYQPIVTADGTIVGVESLARWDPHDTPVLSPAEFVPAAEETGVVGVLGQLSRADAVDLLREAGRSDFFVSVNLSPKELANESLLGSIMGSFAEAGMLSRVHLELTESQLMEIGPKQHRLFSSLAQAGVRFLIDDFGTGYSSITRLRELPVHGVKLDRSFLEDAESDTRVRAVLEGAITMVQGLGLELIAEGVESEAQVELLRNAGCRLFQGYHFHRPMPREALFGVLGSVGDTAYRPSETYPT